MFLDKRVPVGTSSLIESILRPDSILSRLEMEKDCGSFKKDFRQLRLLLELFADMISSNDGRCLEDILLELQFQPVESYYGDEVVRLLSRLRFSALRAEDNMEKVYTEIALRQQDRKPAAARRSIALQLLPFSKGKYHGALDKLRSELNNIVSDLQQLYDRAQMIMSDLRHMYHGPTVASNFCEYFGSPERGTVFPENNRTRLSVELTHDGARGMDSDLHKDVLLSKLNPWKLVSQRFLFDRPVVDVAETWGRDEDLKAIVTRLLSDKVPVLPIVGVPSVGKTTLAWLLYCNDNDQVSNYFRRRLWLNVSNGFNLDEIAEAIEAIAIELNWIPDQQEVQRENPIITGNDAPQRTFMKIFGRNGNVHHHKHRYLIIVDGLKYENRHQWLAFREFLKGTDSRVIITTRHTTAISEGSVVPYVLQGLPELYSWQYLLDIRLHSQSNTLPKPLPRFIARAVHCSEGVPLVLNILKHHMDTDPRYLNCEEIVMLRLSRSLADDMRRDFFVNLPDHLRNCFAYCSLFPPGYEMDKSTLIQLWMAQGFISTQSDSDAEDLGDDYFMDLMERSLLSETHTDEFGNTRSCKMHKLMYDLSLLIASHIVNKGWLSIYSHHSFTRECQHVSHGNSYLWLDTSGSLEDLRTLLFLDQEDFAYLSLSYPSPEVKIQQKLGELGSLRVFDLHEVDIKRVPASINEMKLLRYLDLSRNPNIIMLPDSITQLIHSQTLKLSHCEKLKELPKGIARLESLRHLEIVGCLGLTHMPCGIGQLTALRTLSMFVVGDESGTSLSVGALSELKALNCLRGKLELRHLERARSSPLASLDLEKKEKLESVALVWETTDAENNADGSNDDAERTFEGLQSLQNLKGFSIHGYRGVNFPGWFSTLFKLVKITVKDCHSCRSLPSLHQLPCLKYLILESMDSLEHIISDISATTLVGFVDRSPVEGNSNYSIFFPSLMHLSLRDLPHLKGWLNVNDATSNPNQILEHSFPMLSQITLDDCYQESNLTLPPAIEDLHICRFSKKRLENLLLQSPLPHLTSLCISSVKDLYYLPETLLLSLSSIKNLELQYCPNLACLPTFLVSLKSLSVVGCDGLTSLPKDIQRLQALETLKLKYCFELDLQKSHSHVKPHNDIDLKWWPQFDLAWSDHGGYMQVQEELDSSYFVGLKSLFYLEIKQLPKLVSLPDAMCKLPSLQQLCLSCCDNLEYLPEEMQHIPNLYKIKINDCPLLKEKCCDKTSRESEKISHIWDRDLDWDEDEDQIGIESLKFEFPYDEIFVED